ncbi:MAG TPA: hypothetical protein VFW09_00675 [Solirubrobacteraceae bacterium]|nr:hypothetical protein [Solirubrobacteraceae bacterium]
MGDGPPLNPTLAAITSLMLLREQPDRLMSRYLAGGLTVSVTFGVTIVLAFNGSHPVKTTRHTLNPAVGGSAAVGTLLVIKGGIGLLV